MYTLLPEDTGDGESAEPIVAHAEASGQPSFSAGFSAGG
jgi:hypothetical protein